MYVHHLIYIYLGIQCVWCYLVSIRAVFQTKKLGNKYVPVEYLHVKIT